MNSHDKALSKKSKHKHKASKDGRCEVCNISMKDANELNEKGKRPRKEFGAKNNDSEED